jgi:hypothetical protein
MMSSVMAMANTPSLNASVRLFGTGPIVGAPERARPS